jgi:hypothetical protein
LGQRIEITKVSIVDDSIILTTDRSLTGTDGEGYDSVDEACDSDTFAGKLAVDLFEADDAIVRVYIASNVVVIKRRGGWPPEASKATSRVVEEFFLYYLAA